MTELVERGTFRIPEAHSGQPESSAAQCEAGLAELAGQATSWFATSPADYAALCDEMIDRFLRVGPDWVAAARQVRRIPDSVPAAAAEEWLYGIGNSVRYLRFLRESLRDIHRTGRPNPPRPPRRRPNGRWAVPVIPADLVDRLTFPGFSAELWLQPGVDTPRQATSYHGGGAPGVSLVLGAGNVAAIPVTDALDRLFIARRPVALKMNPVNDYLGRFIEDAMAPLVDRGVLRFFYGGAEVGARLLNDDRVTDVHLTGSDKTFEAIVFGTGEDGAARKRDRRPLLTKPVTGELGNVTPVIVVPGPWSDRDLATQAENIATMLVSNGGFNCIAVRAVVTHRQWPLRERLLEQVRNVLAAVPPRYAYYPGAEDRLRPFLEAHPDAVRVGEEQPGYTPWTLVANLDPTRADEICFTTESFASLFGETALDAGSPADFVRAAVDFCNERLWGTLGASVLVHPASRKDPQVNAAVEAALEDLRYGTVAVNHWTGINFALATTTWGAYPGHDITDVQSGIGIVHNALMYEDVEKTVLRGPFRMPMKPAWFVTNRNPVAIQKAFAQLQGRPNLPALLRVTAAALRG